MKDSNEASNEQPIPLSYARRSETRKLHAAVHLVWLLPASIWVYYLLVIEPHIATLRRGEAIVDEKLAFLIWASLLMGGGLAISVSLIKSRVVPRWPLFLGFGFNLTIFLFWIVLGLTSSLFLW